MFSCSIVLPLVQHNYEAQRTSLHNVCNYAFTWYYFAGTMAVVCLMIQNLISLHIPEINIIEEGQQLKVNGEPIDINHVPNIFLKLGRVNFYFLCTYVCTVLA